MKHKLTLISKTYTKVGDDYDYVTVETPFEFRDLEDLSNAVGMLYEGAGKKGLRIELKQIQEDADAK